jgi:hypothetical protein
MACSWAGALRAVTSAVRSLAEIHRDLGSPLQAVHWFEQAVRRHWAAHNPASEVLSLSGVASPMIA